ncbi:MAG: FHA domain-containing protein [Eggerthellaceae bacterium]|jgi:hypothetical protein|nr:FHA domain-containing protein [Eggerthellaceae bacterium]MDR2715434.1 FHA domain-containing protein [Coriobacteriaceae bacterium]
MGIFSKFEGHVEDTFEGAANKIFDSPISPVQIAKKAERQMRREKVVGAGKQYAPTLYTILVNTEDDRRLFGYYPTLAGETETYLSAKSASEGLVMDGHPLVRFITDHDLKSGKFEVIAELVASPIIEQLRNEEMERYGIGNESFARDTSLSDEDFDPGDSAVAPSAAPQASPSSPAPNAGGFAPGPAAANPAASATRTYLLNAATNRVHDLVESRIVLGREAGNSIVVDDINASRSHAEIRFDPQGLWVISDLGSTNGTLLNGQDVKTQVLNDGDYITIGMTNFVFVQVLS